MLPDMAAMWVVAIFLMRPGIWFSGVSAEAASATAALSSGDKSEPSRQRLTQKRIIRMDVCGMLSAKLASACLPKLCPRYSWAPSSSNPEVLLELLAPRFPWLRVQVFSAEFSVLGFLKG